MPSSSPADPAPAARRPGPVQRRSWAKDCGGAGLDHEVELLAPRDGAVLTTRRRSAGATRPRRGRPSRRSTVATPSAWTGSSRLGTSSPTDARRSPTSTLVARVPRGSGGRGNGTPTRGAETPTPSTSPRCGVIIRSRSWTASVARTSTSRIPRRPARTARPSVRRRSLTGSAAPRTQASSAAWSISARIRTMPVRRRGGHPGLMVTRRASMATRVRVRPPTSTS